METVKRSPVARDSRGERKEQAEYRGFQGSETILYNTVTMDTCLHILSKPTECTTERVNLDFE